MKKVLTISILLISHLCISQELGIIDRIGLDASFNAVGDEVVIGVTLYAEHDQFHWDRGKFYYGIGMFYGLFPNTSDQINRYVEGRTSLYQPIQVHVGHQFIFWKEKLMIRTALIASPSFFNQKITFDDERYDLHETFKYSEFAFTMHAKLGISLKASERTILELFTHLPVVNEPIAPLGGGVGVIRTF